MLQCPACPGQLKEITHSDQILDRCLTCNGLFFDRGELEIFVQLIGLINAIKLDEEELEINDESEQNREMTCPKDQSPMEKREIAGYVIDLCSQCGGIWLDEGELFLLKEAQRHIYENYDLYVRLGQ